uniref:Immunoglobulin V-set domain-containing protein n=1 Tax=Cyprinus carpio TaxID=7962 RepID=A0A8C1UEV8_CYPCA
ITLMLQFTYSLYKVPPVVRHEGESAEIICPYDSIYKSKPKSLCKGKCSTRDRNPLSETVREEKETKTGRLTLNDNITAGVFTGTITGLTAEDAGKYWCTVTLETDPVQSTAQLPTILSDELIYTAVNFQKSLSEATVRSLLKIAVKKWPNFDSNMLFFFKTCILGNIHHFRESSLLLYIVN